MSCVEKRHINHRTGSMLHHRFPNGFTDLFMDETDREVSTLTDRAFRSLCIGDDAVFNDDFLYGYSPYSCLKPLAGEPFKKNPYKESKKAGQPKPGKSDDQPWKQQQQDNISHMSSFLKVLSTTEERNGGMTDSNGESWDKSALRSIERELSEFSSDYRTNNTVTNIISADNVHKWYDLPFYKELTEAHTKEILHTGEVQSYQKEAVESSATGVLEPTPDPPPCKALPKPAAPLAQKRCSSDGGDKNAAPWRRNGPRAKSAIPANQLGKRPQESNSKPSDENILVAKKDVKSVEVKAIQEVSSLASTPFSICQLMTPVILSRQPTETSEILQEVISPSILDLLSRPHSEAKVTPEPPVKRETYKSLASSILFNLKDNRKRVKSRYSPHKFKSLELSEGDIQSPPSDNVNHPPSEGCGSGISTPAISKDGLTISKRQGRSTDRHARENAEHRDYSSDSVISNVPVYKAHVSERPMSDRPFNRSQSIDRYLGGKEERRLSADMPVSEKLEPRTKRIEKSIMQELQQRSRAKDKPSTARPLRRSQSIDAYNTEIPPLALQSSHKSQFSRQSSMEHAVLAQSISMTQRKLLQDPDSGQYFFVDLPVQVKTKTFFDPGTGSYVQLPVQPPDGGVPSAPHVEVLTSPLVVYHSFVPVPLSPMAQKATIQAAHVEPNGLEQRIQKRTRQMHIKEEHPYLEPAYGQHELMLAEFLGTEELDCPC
ncbi:hypothetical protein GOODEAATRI_008454 [Goodea atripinnis]|uniref:DUF4585 domain-containing protein n=1 Tax=Goodea atripinnis TaxID=208336 RepID=A0ABV0MZQ1_9TELE